MVPVWCLITVLMTAPLWAAEESATELAKKTQNPVADLISELPQILQEIRTICKTRNQLNALRV